MKCPVPVKVIAGFLLTLGFLAWIVFRLGFCFNSSCSTLHVLNIITTKEFAAVPKEIEFEEDLKALNVSENPGQQNYEPDLFIPFAHSSLAYLIYQLEPNLTDSHATLFPLSDEDSNIQDAGIHIITTFFRGTYQNQRFLEVIATLVSNLENPYVSKIHLLCEGSDPTYFLPPMLQEVLHMKKLLRKLVVTQVKLQPTYSQLFEYANKNLHRGSIAVVTNADIYFDASLKCLQFKSQNINHNVDRKDRPVIALSRRHSNYCNASDSRRYFDLCYQYRRSHDSFIFAPPIPDQILPNVNHTQNQGYGSENIVIFEFKSFGFRVTNPCYSIHGFHLHCSAERHYEMSTMPEARHRYAQKFPSRPKCHSNRLNLY